MDRMTVLVLGLLLLLVVDLIPAFNGDHRRHASPRPLLGRHAPQSLRHPHTVDVLVFNLLCFLVAAQLDRWPKPLGSGSKVEPHIATSVILSQLLIDLPQASVSLAWLLGRFHNRTLLLAPIVPARGPPS